MIVREKLERGVSIGGVYYHHGYLYLTTIFSLNVALFKVSFHIIVI